VIYFVLALLAGGAIAGAIRYRKSVRQRSSPERCDLISDDLLEFLEQADDAYILSHLMFQIEAFSPYATGAVCNALLDDMYRKPPRMFGTKKYRRRHWSVVEHHPDWLIVRKRLTHEKVKAGRGIYIALGDDMEELWTVSRLADGYLISNVQQC